MYRERERTREAQSGRVRGRQGDQEGGGINMLMS